VTVCVGTEPVGARKCPTVTTLQKTTVKTTLYVGKKEDSCSSVLNTLCKKFKDTTAFSKSSFREVNKVPNCLTARNFQFCCPV